jgi:hypothetical protein
MFLPALYALWYRITPDEQGSPIIAPPTYEVPEADGLQPITA